MLIFIKVSAILAIGLAIILFSILNNPVRIMQKKGYRAEINPFSIEFNSKDGKDSFKISPFDDYLYSASAKNHLIQNAKFKQNINLVNELEATLQKLFSSNEKLIWQITKDKLKISYEIADQGNDTIQIKRELKNLPPGTESFGQAIVLCKDCLVVNGDKSLIYLSADLLTSDKLQKVSSLNLIPLIVAEQLPTGISKLFILGSDGNVKLELEVSSDQVVYLHQDWNILELKTPIVNKTTTNISQTIKFYSN